ncbi:ROK family protein [Candidatus Falkowbacteria bacterium]|nr:ROK family protein [Candidatus Falkowbacteria bacterium]
MSIKYVYGFDLGGTFLKLRFYLVDGMKELFSKKVSLDEANKNCFIRAIAGFVEEIKKEFKVKKEEAIAGLGAPGIYAPRSGVVIDNAPNCPWVVGEPLAQDLSNELDLRVYHGNDAKLFALAEALMGAGKLYKVVAFLGLGTGVGGGIVKNGQLDLGAWGYAGELGHISFDVFNGRPCACGNKGCLEAYAGTDGICKTLETEISSLRAPSKEAKELAGCGDSRRIVKEVFTLARDDDQAAKNAVLSLGAHLGMGIQNILITHNPDIIVIGGSISNDLDMITDDIKHYLKNMDQKCLWENLVITKSHRSDDGGALGAALYALQKYEESVK